jgi:hypothetical protein
MNEQLKTVLLLVGVVAVAAGAIIYGALTPQAGQQAPQPSQSSSPAPAKVDLAASLESERATIHGVLIAGYPKVATDYTISREELFDKGQWYGALLIYKGTDTDNRDTLRVLMEKKDGVWTLRTTPPQMLLSVKQFPDAPRSALQSINRAVSLP